MKFQFIIIGFLASLGLSCQPKPRDYYYEVKRGNIVSSVLITGRIEASQRAVMTAPFDGVADSLFYGVGQRVQKGAVLAILNSKTIQEKARDERTKVAQLESKIRNLEAQFKQLDKEVESYTRLFKTRSIANQEFEQKKTDAKVNLNDLAGSKSELAISKENLDALNKQLDESILHAPFTGMITSTWIPSDQFTKGSPFKLGDTLITVSGSGTLSIKASVREDDVLKIAPGMPITVSVTAVPNRTWKGTIYSVDDAATIDTNSGVSTFRVVIRFNVSDLPLKTGMEAKGFLTTARKENALSVPRAAVWQSDNKYLVQVLKENKILEAPVSPGIVGDSQIEILQGLEEGDTVVAIHDPSSH